jgi:hypothetical protein
MLHDEFIIEFLETLPEFKLIAEHQFSSWRGRQPPLYVFLASVLDPYLVQELPLIANPELLARIFKYLEKLAGSDVKGVEEALVSTLSWLANFEGLLGKASEFMGPKTLKLSQEIELDRNGIPISKFQPYQKKL